MADVFSWLLFGIALVAAGIISLYSYYSKQKIKMNPGTVLLSAFFFMSLWLFDLSTLSMYDRGLWTTAGVNPLTGRVPMLFVAITTLITMFIIAFYNQLYNQKVKSNKFNNLVSIVQIVGLFLISLFAGLYWFHVSSLFGIYMIGLYHSQLPLLIITELVLMINLK